jgi:hypothetical protein
VLSERARYCLFPVLRSLLDNNVIKQEEALGRTNRLLYLDAKMDKKQNDELTFENNVFSAVRFEVI